MGNQKPKSTLKGPGRPALNESFLKSGRASCSRHFRPPFHGRRTPAQIDDPSRTAVHRPAWRRSNSWPIPPKLTLDLDPDNEFLWEPAVVATVQKRFKDLVAADAGKDLSEYNLRRIGSELEGTIRQLLQAGELKYNPDAGS